MQAGYDAAGLLQRVLLLERQQGFQDRAAVGGLEAFARAQAQRAGTNMALAEAAQLLERYSGADRRGREGAVAAALGCLLRGPGGGESGQKRPGSATLHAVETRPERELRPDVQPRPPLPAPRPHLAVVHTPSDLEAAIRSLKGMRKAMADGLSHLGVVTIRDVLRFFPRTHYDYTDTRSISRLRFGEKTTLVGTISDVRTNRTRRGVAITTAAVSDRTGTVAVRWFNQPFIAKQLPLGARIAVTGEADVFHGTITFQPRDFELIEEDDLTHAARLVPMYPLTRGLYQKSLRKFVRGVVEEYADALPDYLPESLPRGLHLPTLSEAIRQYHFPADAETKTWAEQRLAFDELLVMQLGLLQRKQAWQQPLPEAAIPVDRTLAVEFERSLPFVLTRAQRGALEEILADMARPVPMSRLLQGDVGSGKTVVAAAALHQLVHAGRQGVMMAPTEILAEQHFRTLCELLGPFGVRCELLIGSTPRAQKREVYAAARDGSAEVVVGTHALIQEGLEFARLGLAITDEQHRFGVEQRATLRQKGLHPHILAMTATPIPRSLAMTIYGDLDVSVIDELPPGRVPVITTWSRRPSEAYGVVRDEVRQGRQAFVICPVIEESMESDMRSVMAEHAELQKLTFADLQVGLLHGRMKTAEKEAALAAFRRGEYHILVATSVVEVGIDIPNATVMVIRDAHRFGLAQLHQFRGRVGRGGDQAYCVLLSEAEGDEARERLEAVTATENGFALAEEDLRLRGPGEFWGTRQSGLPELQVARLGDVTTIHLARRAAQEILAEDPDLSLPQHEALRAEVARFWSAAADLS